MNKDKNGIINVPTRNELPKIAEKLATQNNTTKNVELTKLIKQKALITGVPYLFSLVAMGFTLTAVTRIWTQFRYNHLQKVQKIIILNLNKHLAKLVLHFPVLKQLHTNFKNFFN